MGRILLSIAAEWGSLLSSVCFFTACRLFGVCGYLETIYIQSSWGQGHARSAMLGAVFVACFQSFQSKLFSCPGSLFGAKWMSDSESAPTNWLYMTLHVSRSSKVIRGHMRSLTLDDLEWSIFLLRSISGCFGLFYLDLAPIYALRSTL